MESWLPWALGSAFFAGLTAVLGKLGVAGVDSNLAVFLRTLVVALMCALIVAFNGSWRNPASLPGRTLVFLFFSALATGASWLCYYRALRLGPASRVAPVDKLGVVFAMALAFAVLGEKPDLKTLAGGALILAGALVLAL